MGKVCENGVTVLEGDDLEDREPTDEEIREYAEFLGIDCDHESHLLWIAREGVLAPVPSPWRACQAQGEGDVFYFNFETGESTWDHPADEKYRKLVEDYRLKPQEEVLEAARKASKDRSDAPAAEEARQERLHALEAKVLSLCDSLTKIREVRQMQQEYHAKLHALKLSTLTV
mmetsp:Transcript_57315/g.136240  ORF Transcript_57315/g.136240 Transcript_57315/m.136240 type:complete len:173 (-) Transcript_57315:332-850(-)